MRSQATPRFWHLFKDLPADVQRLAVKNYRLWQANPNHPSLRYRRLEGRDNLVTVRIGDHYRALASWNPALWFGSGLGTIPNTVN
jgi:hypothetical protein